LNERLSICFFNSFSEIYGILKEADITRSMDNISECILSFFRLSDAEKLSALNILDAGGGISEKLCKTSHTVHSYKELVAEAAGKKYPHARIKRAILHCMSGATLDDARCLPAFATVLGFNQKGRETLSEIRHTCNIPLLTKPADAALLGDAAIRQSSLSNKIDSIFTLAKPNISKSYKFITKSPIIF